MCSRVYERVLFAGGLLSLGETKIQGTSLMVLHLHNGENRFNPTMIAEMQHALTIAQRIVESDNNNTPLQPCALVTVSEGKHWCLGLDLEWLKNEKSTTSAMLLESLEDIVRRIITFPLPTVALLNGTCAACVPVRHIVVGQDAVHILSRSCAHTLQATRTEEA